MEVNDALAPDVHAQLCADLQPQREVVGEGRAHGLGRIRYRAFFPWIAQRFIEAEPIVPARPDVPEAALADGAATRWPLAPASAPQRGRGATVRAVPYGRGAACPRHRLAAAQSGRGAPWARRSLAVPRHALGMHSARERFRECRSCPALRWTPLWLQNDGGGGTGGNSGLLSGPGVRPPASDLWPPASDRSDYAKTGVEAMRQ